MQPTRSRRCWRPGRCAIGAGWLRSIPVGKAAPADLFLTGPRTGRPRLGARTPTDHRILTPVLIYTGLPYIFVVLASRRPRRFFFDEARLDELDDEPRKSV